MQRRPSHVLPLVGSSGLHQAQAAIRAAVADTEAEDKDCRVLDLGAGAGTPTALKTFSRDTAADPCSTSVACS